MTDLEIVRLLVSDVGGESGKDFLYTDEEIEAFLTINGGDVRRAAAEVLRAMAANEAMVQKVITFLQLKTDGRATAEALLKAAESLDARAAKAEAEGEEKPEFEIAEINAGPFASQTLRYRYATRSI